jgi:hypothetical protein
MIGLLFIITLILSGVSLVVMIKYLTSADNRWDYFYNSFHNKVTFLRRMTDNLNYITFISLLAWGYQQTSLIFVGGILIITLAICYFNSFFIYALKVLLAHVSRIIPPLFKYRNISNLDEYFLKVQPKVNLILFFISLLLWGGVFFVNTVG